MLRGKRARRAKILGEAEIESASYEQSERAKRKSKAKEQSERAKRKSEGNDGGGGGGIWTAREAGEVMNTYIHPHTRYHHPPFTLQ